MNQRIGQPFDDGLVDLGRFAFGFQFDRLAGFAGKVVNQAAETAKQAADRDHAQHHHRVAQFAGQALDIFGYRA